MRSSHRFGEILAEHGITARPKDNRAAISRPAPDAWCWSRPPASRRSESATNLKLGYTAFSKGRFAEAIEKLEQGLAWARRNPALLVGFDNATDVFTNSYAAPRNCRI